jgi:ribonuclease P protein component
MKKHQTLKRNFQRVLKKKIYSGGGLSVFAVPGRGLIGVAVSKTVKGAVKRNRIKRHLREFAMKNLMGKSNVDMILMASDPGFSKKPVKL